MFVRLASDFVCDHAEIATITKTANNAVRVTFKNTNIRDLTIHREYGEFLAEFLSTINPVLIAYPPHSERSFYAPGTIPEKVTP